MGGYLLGLLAGRIQKLVKPEILTYGQLLKLPIGTGVIVKEFGSEFIQHGVICVDSSDNQKKVDVYDGYFLFNEADIWLDL